MKRIFKYFGVLLSVVLLGAVTACNPTEIEESADVGLGIKVFFPTKVVAGQPMTINGSGFSEVREIVFPGGITVSSFELVSGEMIRVTAPSGISSTGGKLIVRTADDEAESRQDLTVGSTSISGYSKQEGETVDGGEQITIFGKDLEFISRVELIDTDGNPLILQDEDFYRKGTSTVVFTVPKKTIFDGTFIGKVYTFDGKEFSLPELTYVPASDGGHWETVETVIWENDGSAGEASWNGVYRFAVEGHETGEEIASIPVDIWEKMKTTTFYATLTGANPQVRITTGWWTDPLPDIQPGNELLVDNGDGTWTLTVDLSGAAFLGLLDDQHLLFTGSGFAIQKLYFSEDIWVDGGGHMEIVKTSVWKNDGSAGEASWNGVYRFAVEGHETGEEIASIPVDIWEKMKTTTFYATLTGANPQVRVTTGWWSDPLPDIQPGNELLVDNGDGTWTLTVDLSGAAFLGLLDDQHLLFTGSGFSVQELYFEEEIWVDDDSGPKEIDIASFTMYQDRSDFVSWPFFPSWSDDKGKWRIMRGGDPAIESLGLTTSSKFIVYKEAGTTGQIQWNNPNWQSFAGIECNDWDGSAETIEVPVTEDMLKCINGEITDGWSDTCIILQGDGLKVNKIVIVP